MGLDRAQTQQWWQFALMLWRRRRHDFRGIQAFETRRQPGWMSVLRKMGFKIPPEGHMSKPIRAVANAGLPVMCGTEIRGERSVGWQRSEVMSRCCKFALYVPGHEWSQPPAKGHRGWAMNSQAPY